MTLLEEIARHLAFLGFGEVADREMDGNIFLGRLPERDGLTLAVLAADAGVAGRSARIQLIARSEKELEAFTVCQGMAEALADFEGYLMGYGRRVSVRVQNGAHGLGADDRRRSLYACNLTVRYCG